MDQNFEQLADQFKALGDPTRLKIIKMLLSTEKLCVGMIAHNLGITCKSPQNKDRKEDRYDNNRLSSIDERRRSY